MHFESLWILMIGLLLVYYSIYDAGMWCGTYMFSMACPPYVNLNAYFTGTVDNYASGVSWG
jgi:hypothetical protein